MSTGDQQRLSPKGSPQRPGFAEFRSLFPALERKVWLDCATSPPAAAPVTAALRRALSAWESGEFDWQEWEDAAERTRRLFAALACCNASSIALIPSVGYAAETVASHARSGRIVLGAREFASNRYPWQRRAGAGCEVVALPGQDNSPEGRGVVTTSALLDAITPGTTVVAVSEIQSSNGFRVDLDAVGQRCREVGSLLFVNLTQSIGALRRPLQQLPVDFAVAHGYKWLLCPRGAAWFYARPGLAETVEPLVPSWKSAADPENLYDGPLLAAPGARRHDASLAWLSWVGAVPALELLLALDPEATERRCLSLAHRFLEQASERHLRTVRQEMSSHIVGLAVGDPEAVLDRLASHQIKAAVRDGLLRIGFHAFNNEADVDSAIQIISDAKIGNTTRGRFQP